MTIQNDVEYINSLPSHTDTIRCPECESIQEATVIHTWPWAMFVHDCTECGYIIMESEWEPVEGDDLEEHRLYRGEAIAELVAQTAARVTEANGFDGDEQAAAGCRVRPLAIGCGNGTQWYTWTNASADGYPVWVQNEDCTPFDDESVFLFAGGSNE